MTVEWILTPDRLSAAMGLVAAYTGMCWGIGAKVRKQRLADEAQGSAPQGKTDAPAVLVVYSSQTGQAEALARATAAMLMEGACRCSYWLRKSSAPSCWPGIHRACGCCRPRVRAMLQIRHWDLYRV